MGQGLVKSVWLGTMSYFSAGPSHVGTTWPAKIIMLGFIFFVYISVSSYTANLASFMITKATAALLVSSIGEIAKVLPALPLVLGAPGMCPIV